MLQNPDNNFPFDSIVELFPNLSTFELSVLVSIGATSTIEFPDPTMVIIAPDENVLTKFL